MDDSITKQQDPRGKYDAPPYPGQAQKDPGITAEMRPKPDHGEESYRGSGKLEGKKIIITGGDSGIGRAVAIACSREGADILVGYLSEDEDANETKRLVEEAGRRAVLVKGDVGEEPHCKKIVEHAITEFGQIDVLINNAAYQMARETLQDVSSEEWEYTFKTNIHAMFYLCKAAEPHMKPGSSIINTTSINVYNPRPFLLAYAATKGAIQNFTANLAQLLGDKGIRVNCVAPGPIWTPLIPATMPEENVRHFGEGTPLGRAGQPAEVAPVFVLLASNEGSYISGATVPVTGGKTTF